MKTTVLFFFTFWPQISSDQARAVYRTESPETDKTQLTVFSLAENKRLPKIDFYFDLLTVLPSNEAIVWNQLSLNAIGIGKENYGQVRTLCRLLTKDPEFSDDPPPKRQKKKAKP